MLCSVLRRIRKVFREPFRSFLYYVVGLILRFTVKRIHIQYLIIQANFSNIPVYIISYNRLEYLQQILKWLEDFGYSNITIIDNHSDYEPLLSFYDTCPHKIIRMDKNYGHTVFYDSNMFFWKRLFGFCILTDPDLSPIEECPGDFAEQFLRIMLRYPDFSKVGFSLRIDDLPDEYYLKQEVIEWESRFYENSISYGQYKIYYDAAIDTTFALSAPSLYQLGTNRMKAIRTGNPYQLRHLPWYVSNINSEQKNYISTSRKDITTWNGNRSKAEIRNIIGHKQP